MQKETIISAMQQVLSDNLAIANIDAFSPQARLNEDLYLDSVLLMQLLINLELNLDITIPDSAFTDADFVTVDTLADFLLRQSVADNAEANASSSDQTGSALADHASEQEKDNQAEPEEFEDIKVHCFVSCLCEIIKADQRVDHRPFYFGVWDADVVVDEKTHINYHSQSINHDFFKAWYQKLFGVTVTPWYKNSASKAENIDTLLSILDSKNSDQQVMVMLDLFRLPERENKFNQNPFPHYVMLENTKNPENLFMIDPDFRWEGEQNKAQIIDAISSDAVSGGYHFNRNEIRTTPLTTIYDYFNACFKGDKNPMTEAVRTIISQHLDKNSSLSLNELGNALTQLPVLAIRKYAYEHGFAYFLLELGLFDDEFEDWCDVIEMLVSTYKKIQFRAMKIATNAQGGEFDPELASEIFTLLVEQDAREFSIKHRLHTIFVLWAKKVGVYDAQTSGEVLA